MQGTPKSGLMGFCDCALGHSKELKVLFLHNREPHMCTLADEVSLLKADDGRTRHKLVAAHIAVPCLCCQQGDGCIQRNGSKKPCMPAAGLDLLLLWYLHSSLETVHAAGKSTHVVLCSCAW